MATTQALQLEVTDWSRSRKVTLSEIDSETPVGDVVSQVKDALGLPYETPYHLLRGGEKLNRSTTLEEAGLENGEELTIAPEVSAG